jgi:hypothetical protein
MFLHTDWGAETDVASQLVDCGAGIALATTFQAK